MLVGRPLYDNAADAELFVEPPVLAPLRRAIDRRLNVMVVGPRGVGKTSLLRQMQHRLRKDGVLAAFVDGTAAEDAAALAEVVRGAVTGRVAPPTDRLTAALTTVGSRRPPPGGASRALYDDLMAVNAAEARVVFVDASGAAAAVYGVFGRMRDTVWQGGHTWVVAIDDSDRRGALAPPADAFFDVLLNLPEWDIERLQMLIRRRLGDADASVLGPLAEVAGGNPRAALRALSEATVSGRTPLEELDARAALERRAAQLGRPHALVLAEVLERGHVSPSDEALQRALGVSRGRLSQVLGELQSAGVLRADTAKPDGPGRPRKLYRVAVDA